MGQLSTRVAHIEQSPTATVKDDGQDDVIFFLILFECHGLVPVAIVIDHDLSTNYRGYRPSDRLSLFEALNRQEE